MGHGKKKTECQDTFCIMENFYKDMTYLAVYDGHGIHGRTASDLANSSIQRYLRDNKEELYALDGEDDVAKFFKRMCSKVQDQFQADVTPFFRCGLRKAIKKKKIYIYIESGL